MSMDVSTCNLTVNSNENTIGPVHYYRFLTICMCKYYDKYTKPFSKRARHSTPSILVTRMAAKKAFSEGLQLHKKRKAR